MIRRLVDFPGWESFAQISYSICHGLMGDNVGRARGSGYEDGREEVMLLKGEIGSSATFLLGARTRFGSYNASTIVCFTEHFMGLTTLSSGYSKFFFQDFKCNLRLVQSNCDIKWMFRTRIRDT